MKTTDTARVALALTAAADDDTPSGTSASMSNTIGRTVTGISMMTVPATIGVKTRRNSDRRAARANWNSAETATSSASSPGPPASIAATDTAMKAPEVPISRM